MPTFREIDPKVLEFQARPLYRSYILHLSSNMFNVVYLCVTALGKVLTFHHAIHEYQFKNAMSNVFYACCSNYF